MQASLARLKPQTAIIIDVSIVVFFKMKFQILFRFIDSFSGIKETNRYLNSCEHANNLKFCLNPTELPWSLWFFFRHLLFDDAKNFRKWIFSYHNLYDTLDFQGRRTFRYFDRSDTSLFEHLISKFHLRVFKFQLFSL